VVAWGLWLLALTANLLTYVFFVVPDRTRSPTVEPFDWMTGWLPFMVFLTVGTVIVARRPENVIGWLCCAIGAAASFSGFGGSDAARSIAADPDRIPGALVLHLLGQVLFLVPMLGLLRCWFCCSRPAGCPHGAGGRCCGSSPWASPCM
jgi:hypothetical protein